MAASDFHSDLSKPIFFLTKYPSVVSIASLSKTLLDKLEFITSQCKSIQPAMDVISYTMAAAFPLERKWLSEAV